MIPHSYRKTSETDVFKSIDFVSCSYSCSFKIPFPLLYLMWEKYKDLVSLGFLILCPLLTAWN